MGIDNIQALKNMGEYEDDIPEEVMAAMARNNLTRAQAEDVIARRKKFDAELDRKKRDS